MPKVENTDIIHPCKLSKFKFDHAPFLLNFENKRVMNRRRHLFRFESIYLTHPTYSQLIKDNWRGNLSNVPDQLRELLGLLKDWKKETFGDIYYEGTP